VPLIFMGEEYGETNPFLYFVSHGDPALVDAVRSGRKREFESFGWGESVPDPQAEETFRRSILDRGRAARPEHAAVFALYRDLLALRDEEPMLRPDGADVTVDERDGCITLLRTPRRGTQDTGALLAIFNCTDGARDVSLPDAKHGSWTLRLTTDAAGYGGVERGVWSVEGEPWSGDGAWRAEPGDEPLRLMVSEPAPKRAVSMPPWTAALYIRRSSQL